MRRVYRSREDKVVAGVCAGLGEVYETDPTLIRLGLIFLGLSTGGVPLLVTYIIGAIIIPLGPPPRH